jgi:hypothetical protein
MASGGKGKSGGLKGQELKAFRSQVAKLKSKGIVSKRVDARSQSATRYMRSKVRAFSDVLEGRTLAVRAPKDIRQKYIDAGIFQARGSFLIVPKEDARSRARIKKGRGLVEITTPLTWGQEHEIVLPFKATNMMDLANRIAENPNFDELKRPDEQFAFRLFGHNSRKAFVNGQEFADHVLRNYQHLFSGKKGLQAVRHLSVIRFKGYGDEVPEPDTNSPYYEEPTTNTRRPINRKGRNGRRDTFLNQRRAKDANRKAKARESESPSQRNKRLAEQRQRSARNRQRKFDEQ